MLGYSTAGAASGFVNSASLLTLHGKSLTSDRSLAFMGTSTVTGFATGLAAGTFSSNIANSSYSYGTRKTLIEIGGEAIGVEAQLMIPVINKTNDFAVECPPIDVPTSRPECY